MRLPFVLVLSSFALSAGEFPLGSKLPEASIMDHGKPVTIHPSPAKATALIFVSTRREVTESYSERLQQLYTDYADKNVQFAFVDANAPESVAEVDTYAKAHGWKFKVYKDESNRLADKLNAQVTPEVFLFDKTGTLVYHGRVDDSRSLKNVKRQDTRTALDAVLADRTIPAAETKAFGCTITRASKSK